MINMIKRNEAKILVPIISAYAEGRILQYKEEKGWRDIEDSEGLSINTIIKEAENYRIKPEEKYRPFKDAEECWQELLKHEPFGWVKDTEANEYLNVYCISNSASSIDLFGRMFKRCIFIDGSSYGIKVEE